MNNIEFRTPLNSDEFEKYDLFRWQILREPIGKSIGSLKDEYENSSYHLICVSDNEVIACGRLHFNTDFEAQIRYMAVNNNLQGMGIGRKIIEHLEKYALEQGAKKIVLNARDNVIKFYEKSGYQVVRKFYGSDTNIPHTTMMKEL
tara:strand:- start:2648 stop:3085 length:438 start_codon:yes stop_codon:yes gene_type:complete